MATRQYIGARYVTKIYENSVDPSSAEWEASVNYEPLTMVTYNNGSYLSKKAVPASVGDPASNPAYWAQTGFYNGQISHLQSQIDTINATLTTVNGDITRLFGSKRSGMKNVMIIGDSWLNRTDGSGKNFAEVAQVWSGCNVDYIYQSGAGLYNGNIVTLIDNYTGDGSIYDTVIYAGGGNDEYYAGDNFYSFDTYFFNLRAAINAKFPNASNVYVMCLSQTFRRDSTWTSARNKDLLNAYRIYAPYHAIGYVSNAEYILRDTRYYETDAINPFSHPNADGVDRIGAYVAQFLLNGYIDVYDYLFDTFTDTLTNEWNFYMSRHNNVVEIMNINPSINYLYTGGGSSIPIDGTTSELGHFNHTLVQADNAGNDNMYAADPGNVLILDESPIVEVAESSFYCYNAKLYGKLTSFMTAGHVGAFHITGNKLKFTEV